ncbi:MAG: DUF1015 family protein [Firmicutes bacterium]|nr:DUF1015 family protein [Bacillota bacterium]NBI63648.1 DUF1015 domain-containing protein [Clostridiales bacterium]
MATVRPFRAIRPAQKYAEKVISLPYDVMNRQEAAKMAEGNPYSFLHICRSEIDLPNQKDPYHKSVYEKAKNNIQDFLSKGTFQQEEEPALYIYRQTMDGRVQTGIVGTVAVDEYQNNTIKKHEFTRVEKELDRINHFDICDANTEPVFLTYRDDQRIRDLMEHWISENKPVYDFTTADCVGHALWVVDDLETVGTLTSLFGEIPSLYIADGHHRSASACKVGLKRREENPDYTGDEEFNFFMAVLFPDADLHIFDYNRVIKDLNGNNIESLMAKIKEAGFKIDKMGEDPYYPEAKHCFSMFLEGNWYRLTAKPEIIPDHVIDSLDVAILQNQILEPILGIEDPRTDKRIDFVGGIRGLEELKRRCEADMKIAFAVHPVEIADLLTVSDNDMVMPPKSTWFEPKLGSGLFLHQL